MDISNGFLEPLQGMNCAVVITEIEGSYTLQCNDKRRLG